MTPRTDATPLRGAGRPCGACGAGVFQPQNVQGRTFAYRDERELALTEPYTMLVCTACGEIRESAADADRLDEMLERAYVEKRARQTRALAERLIRAGWRQADIEATIGLSTGYLSKVLRGEKQLTPSNFRHLIHLSSDPGRALHELVPFYPQFAELERHLAKRGALAPA